MPRNPYEVMRDCGHEQLAASVEDTLGDDWKQFGSRTARVLAAGLTYYLRYNEYTQQEIADEFGVSSHSVSTMFNDIRSEYDNPARTQLALD